MFLSRPLHRRSRQHRLVPLCEMRIFTQDFLLRFGVEQTLEGRPIIPNKTEVRVRALVADKPAGSVVLQGLVQHGDDPNDLGVVACDRRGQLLRVKHGEPSRLAIVGSCRSHL